jgi:signal transduction histidine kinase
MSQDEVAALRARIEQLEREERPFRLMVERMAEGALTLDAGDGRILYANLAFATMIDLPLQSVIGRPFETFLRGRDRVDAQRMARSQGNFRVDTSLVRGEGVVPVALSSTTIESPDGPTLCVIVSDRSQRRVAERLRRKQTALETEAQRKDEFIAMLGHELRNPLAPIQHAAELLANGELPPERRAAVHATILRQTLHMRRIVDDLLDTARITQGTLEVERERIDARRVVQSALEVTQVLFSTHPRRLVVQLPPQEVPIDGDLVRLTQVLTNLLDNAAKFTGEDDEISISLSSPDDAVVFEVTDAGRGIEPEMLATIFQPFVQEDVVFDRAVGGLGLGLALVRRLVELHDGVVQATSEGHGTGARFTVRLPRPAPATSAAPTPSTTLAPSLDHRRVLVCDDNDDAAEMLAILLETAGHTVTTVGTGEAAIDAVAANPPDLLFLDIGLPGIDGYEVARQLRNLEPAKHLVIIALTGYGQAEDRDAALAAGCDSHLVKPVDRAELEQALAVRRE